jgi:hypothetical protein
MNTCPWSDLSINHSFTAPDSDSHSDGFIIVNGHDRQTFLPVWFSTVSKDKWNKHGRNYDVIGYAFAPCVMTTYGQIHGHLLRLLYVLAKKQAETVHVHKRPFTHIEHLFGLFFAQSRARIGVAVARGMALRAMGCSLMGVRKVFLRHVAPTRYGDQTFAAGEHLAPGFSQWRLALAA